jgi:hypothetical protein
LQASLKYPSFDVRLRNKGAQTQIFDQVRKKWLALTPEEWVRQHFVNYLISEKKIPASLISIEKELQLNDLRKRYDVVVFDHALKPWLIVECKAPYIPLSGSVVEQALRYNMVIGAEFLMLTNGVADLVFNRTSRVDSIPPMPVIA